MRDYQIENVGDIYQFRYAISPDRYSDWDIFTVELLYRFQELQIMRKGVVTLINFHFQEKLEQIVKCSAVVFLKTKYDVIGHGMSPLMRFVYDSIFRRCVVEERAGKEYNFLKKRIRNEG